MDDPQGLHQQGKARAVVLYYSSRMEAVSELGSRSYLGPFFIFLCSRRGGKEMMAWLSSCYRRSLVCSILTGTAEVAITS